MAGLSWIPLCAFLFIFYLFSLSGFDCVQFYGCNRCVIFVLDIVYYIIIIMQDENHEHQHSLGNKLDTLNIENIEKDHFHILNPT